MSWLHVESVDPGRVAWKNPERMLINTAALHHVSMTDESVLMLHYGNGNKVTVRVIMEYGAFPGHWKELLGATMAP